MYDSLKVLHKMTPINPPYNWQEIKQRIEDGTAVFVGDFLNHNIPGIKYLFLKIDKILYTYKLTDTTNEKLVLVPEQAAFYTDGYWPVLWTYLRNRDFMLADDDCLLEDMDINSGKFSHDIAKEFYRDHKNRKTIFYFQDNRASPIYPEK